MVYNRPSYTTMSCYMFGGIVFIPHGSSRKKKIFKEIRLLGWTLHLLCIVNFTEPHAGSAGLPPPRSAAMEQWKADQAAKRQSPRVQVFMPQSYNTPLGLYTTENIMNTFQQQAGAHMDQMDQYVAIGHLM